MNIATLEIKDGETPQKVHDENLVYNAAGSLYDFILFDLAPHITQSNTYSDQVIDDIGLFKEFQNYLEEKRYYWLHVVYDWTKHIDEKKHRLFDQKYFGDRILFDSISAHLPIVWLMVQFIRSVGIYRQVLKDLMRYHIV
jgi:hypothetical protein